MAQVVVSCNLFGSGFEEGLLQVYLAWDELLAGLLPRMIYNDAVASDVSCAIRYCDGCGLNYQHNIGRDHRFPCQSLNLKSIPVVMQ